MKTTSLILLFSTIAAGVAYAGTQTNQAQTALALPQPCTVFICTAGMAFFSYLTKSKRIP